MLRLRSMCMLSVLSVFGVFVSDVIFRNDDVRMREMIKKKSFFHHAKAKQPSYIYIYIICGCKTNHAIIKSHVLGICFH